MRSDINNKIISYLIKYSPAKIGIFGSYARGDGNDFSDIDILVDFKGQISLFDLGGIKYDLTELLKRPVDIVTERSVNKRIKDYINRDLKIIYE
ncbi:MAG: nucleotidyltransferase family protein [Prolixibacteraceae bacterium]|nr:nucleotidyltransferase family protein [Prolixibacteraceae bacterium]